LSGALTGAYQRLPAAIAWTASSNQSAFSINSSSGDTPQIQVAITFSGEPQAQTWSADAGATGYVQVVDPGASGWNTQAFTLDLSGVTFLTMDATGKGYAGHGTLDAAAPSEPGSASPGTLTIHADF
jgi:hypothetical protein